MDILSKAPYNLLDAKRTAIRGGSAGGYTALAALSMSSNPAAFAAGTSSYGVSDVAKLAEFTHKFESHYMTKLIGATLEENPQLYKDRSPIYHADKITSPLLVSGVCTIRVCWESLTVRIDRSYKEKSIAWFRRNRQSR